MSIGSIIVIGLIVIASLYVLALPLLRKRRAVDFKALLTHDERVTAYERILATIRDLDEDYQTGKIAPEDYQREREYWAGEGVKLLKLIRPDPTEALDEGADEADEVRVTTAASDVDDEVEKAIAAYRQAQAKS